MAEIITCLMSVGSVYLCTRAWDLRQHFLFCVRVDICMITSLGRKFLGSLYIPVLS